MFEKDYKLLLVLLPSLGGSAQMGLVSEGILDEDF
jgi:hypothetical protein